MIGSPLASPTRPHPRRIGVYTAAALYAGGFLGYAESKAFHFDEAYHLLTAQLILAGKRPYIDFCFPQAPLNAYWNAVWMSLFGQTWRVAHAVAALATVAAVLLMADYVFRRFPDARWRAIASVTAAMAIGLNPVVFTYGSLAQPYGICLLGLSAAFRCAVRAVESDSARYYVAAGVCAGIAAASSLLTAAAIPVLLVWILIYSHAGRRFSKALAFLVGAAVPFAPAL